MADSYSPWAEEASGFSRIGDSLGNVFLGLARTRAGEARAKYDYGIQKERLALEREQNTQHGALYKAQAALAAANELLNRKKADQEQAILDTSNELGQTAGNIVRADQGQTPYYKPALEALFAEQGGRLAGLGQQHVPKNMAELASLTDPRLRAHIATDTRLPTRLPVNNQPIDYMGNVLQEGRFNLSPGHTQTDIATGEQITAPSTPYDFRRSIGSSLGPLLRYFSDIKEQNANRIANALPVDPKAQEEEQNVGLVVSEMLKQIQANTQPSVPQQAQPQPQVSEQTGPKVGEVRKGYKFKGGNPADKNSWEKVQ